MHWKAKKKEIIITFIIKGKDKGSCRRWRIKSGNVCFGFLERKSIKPTTLCNFAFIFY